MLCWPRIIALLLRACLELRPIIVWEANIIGSETLRFDHDNKREDRNINQSINLDSDTFPGSDQWRLDTHEAQVPSVVNK